MAQLTRSALFALMFAFAVGLRKGQGSDTHLVSKPIKQDGSLPSKMVILIPGSNVPNANYLKVAESIQAEATALNLWVVVPAVPSRRCNSLLSCPSPGNCWRLNGRVQDAIRAAEEQGWSGGAAEKDIFVGGHGVGGVCANTLFQAYDQGGSIKPYAGLVLLGSYVDDTGSAYSLKNYSVPVLTLNAELDGTQARASKTAYMYRQHLAIAAVHGADAAAKSKPVVLLPDLSASSFSPGHDVQDDLAAETSESSALDSIGSITAAFLHLNAAGAASQSEAVAVMNQALKWTGSFMAPWLAAEALEWTPGNTSNSENGNAEGANGNSPFCKEAQRIMSGLARADTSRMTNTNFFHEVIGNFVSCHAYSTEAGKDVEIETCGHTDYFESTDVSAASRQIACKMWGAVKMGRVLRTPTNTDVTCVAGNEMTVQLVEGLALPRTMRRFKQRGRGFCFEQDERTFIGPQWALISSVRIRTNSDCMSVRSPSLIPDPDGSIRPGVHYCKYLSPTRVLDWMMTDSLKSG